MANGSDPEALRRQLQAHLQRLAAAGIEWLAQGPPLEKPAPTRRAEGRTVPLVQPRLPGVEGRAPPAVAVADPELPLEQRRIGLRQLAEEVSRCTRCPELCSTRTQTVFGDGPAGAEICFIGEA